MVLNISLIDNFHLSGLGQNFNSELFWEHSIATGLIAAAIARSRRSGQHAIDLAFTMGLLHDVARMVFVQQLDDLYKRVIDTATRLQFPLEQVESRMLQVNHVDVVDRLLIAWKFPKSLIEPIAMHHLSAEKIAKLSPGMVPEACTLALADRLAHALLLGFSGNDCQYSTHEFARVLELKPDAIKFIEQNIPKQTQDMKDAMLQSEECEACPEYRLLALKKFNPPVRPLYISSSPEIDGYRILLERLKDPADNRPPNVAFMQLASMKEVPSFFDTLKKRENEAGAGPLPLVIISPLANLKLEPELLAGRKHKLLPSCFALLRLADNLNSIIHAD